MVATRQSSIPKDSRNPFPKQVDMQGLPEINIVLTAHQSKIRQGGQIILSFIFNDAGSEASSKDHPCQNAALQFPRVCYIQEN